MPTPITPEQIETLLSELQVGLKDLAKSEEALAKTHPGEESKPELSEDKSATEPAKDAPPAKDSSAPADDTSAVKPAVSASPAAPAAPGDDMGADPSANPADPAAMDDGPVDPVKLHEEYSQLSPEDLKSHYIACKAALFELMGSGNDGAPSDPNAPPAPAVDAPPMAPPASPAASPAGPPASPVAASPSPSPDAPPTMKGEMDAGNRNGGSPVVGKIMAKSEKDIKIESLESELTKQQETLGKLVKVVETVMSAPMRKSIVSLSEIAPPAKAVTDLSKDEIKAKLKEKVMSGKLSKSDQDLVIRYDFGKVKVQELAHLLDSK